MIKSQIQALPLQVLKSRLGRICVALTGDTVGEMLATAELQVKENPFMEFRLDYLDNPLAALPRVKKFLSENSVVTAVATCRRVNYGGRFKGNVAAQMEILHKAVEAGCQLVDVELETAVAVKKPEIDALRLMAAVILSFHDYDATEGLEAVYARMQKFTPDYYKIVSTARSLHDNVTMMRFLEKVRDEASVIGTCMGDAGIISRVLGVRAGSEFTFAAASVGEETAPGQIAARTLRETYRIDQVEYGTKVYGVAGNPVKHSLSPLMMNVAFRRETFPGVYLQLQTSKVKDLLSLAQEIPLQGFSVTMPLKQDILKYVTTNALTAKVGACNLVVRANSGKLIGYNTDVIGIIEPLVARLQLKGAKVLVLGAGGAARAAVFALKEREADVYILNRTAETGMKLAREAKVKTFRKDQLAKAQWDVIVNATPVGMVGNKQQSWLEPDEVNARFVFDMVYDPLETPLLRTARQRGAQVITGAEMFVYQGAEQFQIWTGKPAPREEMMRVVMHALHQRYGVPEPVVVDKPAAKPAAVKAVAVKLAPAKAVPAKVGPVPAAPMNAEKAVAGAVSAPTTRAALIAAIAAKAKAASQSKPVAQKPVSAKPPAVKPVAVKAESAKSVATKSIMTKPVAAKPTKSAKTKLVKANPVKAKPVAAKSSKSAPATSKAVKKAAIPTKKTASGKSKQVPVAAKSAKPSKSAKPAGKTRR